ncbi:hypothetical protein MHU86_19227 [Fragilaria crotonensis]|nr:hypothetical protein MHU86_19227 [Fragilaria crotonensis]
MVADEKKAGKVGNSPAFYDIAQERLKSDRNHMAHSNDVAADSGRALAIKKKTNIERKKVKVVEQASAISDEILLRTSLAATIHSPGNNEEGGSEKDRHSKQTALPANMISLKEPQPLRERKASEGSLQGLASTVATPSSKSMLVEKDYTAVHRPVMNPPAMMMAEPIVDIKVSEPLNLKLPSTSQADENEDRAQKSESSHILSSKSSRNNNKRQKKPKDVNSERPGRSTRTSVQSRSSEHRGPDLNGRRDNLVPENIRQSNRAPLSGPLKVKPDFVTGFNKSSSFRQADVDGRGSEPAPAQGRRDDASSVAFEARSLSISPEEVLAALMRGGAARKAQRASPVASELKSESSQPFLSSLPASKAAKTRTKEATRTARTCVAVVDDEPPSKSGKSSAMSSNSSSARSPKLDQAVNIDTRRSRSLKPCKSNRSCRRSTALSSDDDSIKFTKPTFRKAPSRRSISQPSIRARNSNALSTASSAANEKRQSSTSSLKAQLNGQSTLMSVSASAITNTGERLRIGGSQVDKNSATPSRAGNSSGDVQEPQIKHRMKSSKIVDADVNVGKSKTKSAAGPPDRDRKPSHRRERSIRSSRSPSRNTGGKS